MVLNFQLYSVPQTILFFYSFHFCDFSEAEANKVCFAVVFVFNKISLTCLWKVKVNSIQVNKNLYNINFILKTGYSHNPCLIMFWLQPTERVFSTLTEISYFLNNYWKHPGKQSSWSCITTHTDWLIIFQNHALSVCKFCCDKYLCY